MQPVILSLNMFKVQGTCDNYILELIHNNLKNKIDQIKLASFFLLLSLSFVKSLTKNLGTTKLILL